MALDKSPHVTVLVLNWNGRDLLRLCLSSLFELTEYSRYNVIVVDNGSTDGSIELVKARFACADVLTLGKNYGFARGNNEGIRYALMKYDPSYILLLNNDTQIIQKDWISKMVLVAEADQNVAVIGARLRGSDGLDQISAAYFTPSKTIVFDQEEITQVHWVSGACFMIRVAVLRHLGALDERYSPCFYEETEYCARCLKNGYKVLTVPTAKLVHLGQQSLRRIEDSDTIYNWCKNEILFFLTNLPRCYLVSILRKDLGEAIFKKQFAATIRGYLDGYRLAKREPLIWRPSSTICAFHEATDFS